MHFASNWMVVSAALTVLIGVASRERHAFYGDVDVYRFPKVVKIALMLGGPVIGALGFAVWSTFPPSRSALEGGAVILIFGSFALFTVAIYVRTVLFVAVVDRDGIEIRDWWRRQTIRFADIHRIVVVWGYRGSGYLELFSDSDRRLCRLESTLQDFPDLVAVVEMRCTKGTPVRSRDRDGKWSEWTCHSGKPRPGQ
jgi:hypothetical protein